ncbi:CHAT domain-containing protein [Pseudofulvibacter geojedonensis]|uniref:CHAT domain-containing protein n=1 Tax=Pseudofulvibacter geojedonensis TaxID=1123758 RepID=A0ABW3HYE0_9FLAO
MRLHIFFIIVLVVNTLLSQETSYNKASIDSIFKYDESFFSKKKKIDSIINNTALTNQQKSYIYHVYARYLNKNNKYSESILAIKNAISIRELDDDTLNLAKSLFNLGLYYNKSGNYSLAIKTFQRLVELEGNERLKNKAYAELILVYKRLGDFEKCFRYFDKIEKFYLANKDFNSLCKSYINISSVYTSMGYKNNDLTILYLKKADSLEKYVGSRDKYIINLSFGNVYEELKKKELALKHYNTALEISYKRKDSNAIALLYNNIGYLYLQDSLYDNSFKYLKKGFLFAEDNARRKASLNYNLADYYLKSMNYIEAKNCYDKAINLLAFEDEEANQELDIAVLENSPNRLKVLSYLIKRANFWYSWYKFDSKDEYLKNALTDFQLADRLTDAITFNTGERLSKLFWREKGANLYIQAIAVCNKLKRTDLAYYFMEKNKALLLLERVNDKQAKLVSNLPEQLVTKDFSYRQQITQASNNADLLFDLKNAYSRFKDSLAFAYPEYARLRKQLPILSIEEHKELFVKSNEATLQFIINNDDAFALAITNNSTDLYELKNVSDLNKNILELRKKLQQPFITKEEVLSYNLLANKIFNTILPTHIYQKLKGKKLSIATDGNLQNIPLEALVVEKVKDTKNIPYLIISNQIDYVYSFSYLNSKNSVLRAPEKTFLAFAPKKFKDNSLSVLSNSVKEVETINTIFNDKVYTESEASKKQFLTDFGNYNIVHLATHSGLDEQTNPWLAFYDSKVCLNEIYATKNQADLVVLSACKTSQGILKSGEGVMSLARGFFFSGTNTVISSLWNLNDKTTEKIMVDFYKKLNNGNSKSEALHKAKLDYISNNSGSEVSPFYWSSFILIGDGIGVIQAKSNSYLYPILVLLITLLFLLILLFFKKSKKVWVTKR